MNNRYNEALWLTARLWRALGHQDVRGPVEGQPVLVIPGFLTSDRSCTQLRRALADRGFRVYPWDLGVNQGANQNTIIDLIDRVHEIHAVHGQPVVLVGWSLGGLFAREVAREIPELIDAVITLGSPISGDLHENNVWRIYEWFTGHKVDETPVPRICEKPPVPTLAIWSSRDGLIPGFAACGKDDERDVAVEIDCTHMAFGMGYHATKQVAMAIEMFLK